MPGMLPPKLRSTRMTPADYHIVRRARVAIYSRVCHKAQLLQATDANVVGCIGVFYYSRSLVVSQQRKYARGGGGVFAFILIVKPSTVRPQRGEGLRAGGGLNEGKLATSFRPMRHDRQGAGRSRAIIGGNNFERYIVNRRGGEKEEATSPIQGRTSEYPTLGITRHSKMRWLRIQFVSFFLTAW